MNKSLPTEILDYENKQANMYGCLPCPRCGSRFRWPDQNHILQCDDCGYQTRWEHARIEGGTS
jgi:hypothetical protein